MTTESIGVYDLGEPRRLEAAFTNAAGTATDPDTVTLRVAKPDGNTYVYTYNVGSPTEVVRTGTGAFYFDLLLDQVGDWYFQWEGSGPVIAIEPGQLHVKGNGF